MTPKQEAAIRELLTRGANGGFSDRPATTLRGGTMSCTQLDVIIGHLKRILRNA